MAWRSSGNTNSELVNNLFRNKLITDPLVRDAFLRVDRAHYAPGDPYSDSPQPIGYRATISAPHMHATALAHLLPYLLPAAPSSDPSDPPPPPRRALDIGSGSGYLTHVMAELALTRASNPNLPEENVNPAPSAVIIGVEHIPQLARLGEDNMSRSERGRSLLESGVVRFRVGDGRKGWIDEDGVGGEGQRYDAIHVGAAAKEVHPELLAQLKAPGRMFIPVEEPGGLHEQNVWAIDKDENGVVTKKKLFGVMYVPLTDAAYYVGV
jgi:protein-L-isoaspartate(D-aspartate) O-methyltransferase